MLVREGIHLIKYWFSVNSEEQARRFEKRIKSQVKLWKFSDMDLQSYMRWDDYSRAKDDMMAYTDIKQAPWYVVQSDDKRRARLIVSATCSVSSPTPMRNRLILSSPLDRST